MHARLLASICVAFGLLAATQARAAVHEIKAMSEILPAIGEGTLVVFDLDNTLITPAQTLGSDEWFYWLVEQKKQQGLKEPEATDSAMALWNQVQQDTTVLSVESGTPDLIRGLSTRGLSTLGLTARTFDVAEVTLRQLDSIGVRLQILGEPGRRPEVLVLDEKTHAELHASVLFVGENNDKGQMLLRILDRLALHPKHVVFVDDKAKHAQSVDRALTGAKIRVDSFRYGAADAKVRAFRGEVADLELSWWRRILSDKAAESLLRCGPEPLRR